MNKKTGLLFLMMILFGGMAFSSSAMADDERGHSSWGRGREQHHDRGYRENRHEGRVVYYVPSYPPQYQPVYYRSWQGDEPEHGVYRVGGYIPPYVRCHEPERNIVAVLPPVYRGTQYVQVDNNVYLVSEASRQILNAVVLLSAVR